MIDTIATILEFVSGVGSLICYVLVLIKMFQRGQTALGIACIVLLLCFGIGGLVVFIYGWIKAKEWNMTQLMTIWTAFFVLGIVSGLMNPALFQQLRQWQVPGRE
jgi:hypothetical protein